MPFSFIKLLLGRKEGEGLGSLQHLSTGARSQSAAEEEKKGDATNHLETSEKPDLDHDSRRDLFSSYPAIDLSDNPFAIGAVIDTGAVTWVPKCQGWCINPSTSFPLTVVGADDETAFSIREAMDGLASHHFEDVAEVVAALMIERGARFYEFEVYLEQQQEVYSSALKAALAKREQFGADDSESDDEGPEDEAFDALDNHAMEFEALLDGGYPDDSAELEAIRSFGFANLMLYLRSGPGTVALAGRSSRKRAGFDSMVRRGLAATGSDISDIPTKALLGAMRLKDLRALSPVPVPTKCRKKDLTIEFLVGQQRIRERVIASTPRDSVYYTIPVPAKLSSLNLDDLLEKMIFTSRVASLILSTYLSAALAPTNQDAQGTHLGPERFKLHNTKDCLTCNACRKMHDRSKPLSSWSRFPLHFGCRCRLLLLT